MPILVDAALEEILMARKNWPKLFSACNLRSDSRRLQIHGKSSEQSGNWFADICVVVTDSKGRKHTLRGLLDSGCSKSIVLKKFTSRETRVKLSKKDCIKYETYGGYFRSSVMTVRNGLFKENSIIKIITDNYLTDSRKYGGRNFQKMRTI